MRFSSPIALMLAVSAFTGRREPELMPVTPEITTTALEDAAVGNPYSGKLEAAGGTGPYTWSLEGVPSELEWLFVGWCRTSRRAEGPSSGPLQPARRRIPVNSPAG